VLLQLLNAVGGVISDEGLMFNCTPTKNNQELDFFQALDHGDFNSPTAPSTDTLLDMCKENMSQLKRRHSWENSGSNVASWANSIGSLVDIENENYMPPFYRFECEEVKVTGTAIQLIDNKTFLEVYPPSEPQHMKPRAKKKEDRKATTTTRFFDATTATTTTLLLH